MKAEGNSNPNYEPILHSVGPGDQDTDVDVLLNDAFLIEGECRKRGEYVKWVLSVAFLLESQAEVIDVTIAQGLAQSLRGCAMSMMKYLKTVDDDAKFRAEYAERLRQYIPPSLPPRTASQAKIESTERSSGEAVRQ
jgi:hypothetical protein